MAEAKKKKKDDPFKKQKELQGHADQIVATIQHNYTRAYSNAADKYLRDPATGLLNHQLLSGKQSGESDKDYHVRVEKQREFKREIVDGILKEAKLYYKSDMDTKDPMHRAMILNAYTGFTEDEIWGNIKKHGDKYTQTQHDKMMEQFMDKAKSQLYGAASEHITDAHVSDFLKMTGLEGKVDASMIKAEHIRGMMNPHYQEFGVLNPTMVDKLYEGRGLPSPVNKDESKKGAKKPLKFPSQTYKANEYKAKAAA